MYREWHSSLLGCDIWSWSKKCLCWGIALLSQFSLTEGLCQNYRYFLWLLAVILAPELFPCPISSAGFYCRMQAAAACRGKWGPASPAHSGRLLQDRGMKSLWWQAGTALPEAWAENSTGAGASSILLQAVSVHFQKKKLWLIWRSWCLCLEQFSLQAGILCFGNTSVLLLSCNQ